ncbi:hypothetical protein BAUCODRAFT_122448 [Baudoinia panamericana UAMH 10762]|uniref:Uncharacterized protein n=1 Tax=Baudoinia panamericana (strain UAMH 10762) TaxID=717646 RepID=M2NC35_BAUPA|nr:uncharacterized protein BAUCODRAFT_122448 [Baudoinia panamericana UAMH 10762]EMC96445.1 hypothetical protein BAUCODRAFT_122448 [Baudoinia panamericana UAMH 10762]
MWQPDPTCRTPHSKQTLFRPPCILKAIGAMHAFRVARLRAALCIRSAVQALDYACWQQKPVLLLLS